MDGSLQIRSLGRFLYTQNPFYLISCGLIIHGLQLATAGGDLHTRSVLLAAAMTGYTVLMSLTVVGVVRWGKVWEDARSIFLVVMISQLALSIGFDLLCVDHWQAAARLMLGGYLFSVLSSEFVLRCCQIKFPQWYRIAYYGLLLVFFAMPVVAGWSVAENHLSLARWSAPIFSSAIAVGMLTLVPAIGRGKSYVADNGTPWQWPWYPLSAFVVVVVIAGIRSHAIWMSFGSFTGSITFEPFLLLPLVLAVSILVAEYARRCDRMEIIYATMFVAPAMISLGVARGGLTNLSIAQELQSHGGSAITVAMAAIACFYLYLWVIRVRLAEHAFVASLVSIGLFADVPDLIESAGVQNWMATLVAALVCFGICLRRPTSDYTWLETSMVLSIAVVQAGLAYDAEMATLVIAGTGLLTAMLAIGAIFETQLAHGLRYVSATVMMLAAFGIVGWHFLGGTQQAWDTPIRLTILGSVILTLVAMSYAVIVRRSWWLYLAGFQAIGLLVLITSASGWTVASVDRAHWPIQSGLVCLAIGLTITSFKSGVHRRLSDQCAIPLFRSYRPGF